MQLSLVYVSTLAASTTAGLIPNIGSDIDDVLNKGPKCAVSVLLGFYTTTHLEH